jgi:hypothetical protein
LRVDQLLMRLEPRHMRIAEQGDARRRKRGRQFGAADHVADGLPRQAVHEIDIDGGDAGRPHRRNRRLDLLERLDAADRALHMGRKILSAETRARDADPAQSRREARRHAAGIELDGMLGDWREIECPLEPINEVNDNFGAENRRRAATPMQMNGRPAAEHGSDQLDFVPEMVGIGHHRRPLPHRLGGAAAIEAEFAAVRNMHIKRQLCLIRQRFEPLGVGV